MKKFLCVMFCVIFVFTLAACSTKSDKKSNHSIDVEYFAKMGKISDVDYKIGDAVDDVKEALQLKVDDHGVPVYFDFSSGEYTVMNADDECVCYKTEDKDLGVTHIIKYGDVYGFTIGDVSTQVRDTMSKMGFDATEREAEKKDLFFLPGTTGMTVLEYEIKEYKVLFVFQEHALSAAVISKK